MIPPFLLYSTDRVRKRIPYATYCLVAVNILTYLGLHLLGTPQTVATAQATLGFVPARGNWYSIFTSMFVHASPLHLLQNLLFLWIFGSLVEDTLGMALFLTLFFGSQFGANLLHASVAQYFGSANATKPMIGASGAVAGLLGLAAIRFYRTRLRIAYWVVVKAGVVEVAAWIFIALWAGWEACTGVVALATEGMGQGGGEVAHFAHLGGFAFGIVGALMLRLRAEGHREYFMEELRRNPLSACGYDVVRDLQGLARQDPTIPQVHHALAKQYLLERRHELAGHAYLRAVDCYLKRGDHAGAAEAYEELTGCYPECLLNLRNQFGVALALEQQGHFSRAAHAFQQLVDAYPKSQEAQVSLMRAATLCLDRLADLPAALACLDRLIAQYPHGQWHDMARRQRDHVGRMLGQ